MTSLNTLSIDFGTSNSLVGAFINGKTVDAIPLDSFATDPTLMRTLLYFPNANSCYYGAEAIIRYQENDLEGRLFRSFKSHLPNQNYLGTMLDGRVLSLEVLIGTFLLELKRRSEKFLGQKIDRAVIGRPARYSMDDVSDGFAITRMRKASEFAGFKEVIFVPEPLAAALSYRKELADEKIVLIGDFGGGTSDFTIMKMSPKPFQKSDVLSVEGCPLAGDAIDSLFMSHRLNQHFGAKVKYKLPMSSNWLSMPISTMERLNKPSHIVHLKEKETYSFIKEIQKCALNNNDKESIERLFILIEDQQIFQFFEQIEKAKISLSKNKEANFNFDYPDLVIQELFNRNEFESWAEDVKSSIFSGLDRCLNHASLNEQDIDLVFLTGGTAHVPFIYNEFVKRFGVSKLQGKSYFHSVLSGLSESAKLWRDLEEA